MKPKIQILATGGTIASTQSEDGSNTGATPKQDIDELVSSLPSLDGVARVEREQVTQVDSTNLPLETVAKLARRIEDIADDTNGIVVTHGTDLMEETAYYLDLVSTVDIPVVLTGAQRRPDEVSPDGPANLVGAIRAAAHAELRERSGTYVLMNDALHAAQDVMKLHASNVATFRSPGTGPIAEVTRDGFRFFREPGSHSISLPVHKSRPTVEMIKSGLDVNGKQIVRALESGADGIVVEATGLGNVSSQFAERVKIATDCETPVVLTSRCIEGSVAPVYSTTGGSLDLKERSVIFGSDLPAHKARIKLLLALDYTDDKSVIRTMFERPNEFSP